MTAERWRFRSLLRSGSGIAAAMAVMNVSTYGFTVLAARQLGPRSYGALAGLMATLLVVGVLQLGLQTTAARRISSDPDHTQQIEAVVLRVTYAAAAALGVLLLLLSPVVSSVLRLEGVGPAALVALTAVPMTVMGGQAGVLQGERRWRPLAVLYVAAGAPRLLFGAALLSLWSPSTWNAMLAVALGACVPVVVGWAALRQGRPQGRVHADHAPRPVIREALASSQALLGFFALSNVDVIVARSVLDPHQAGLYAGGLILAKAVLFLPQFVLILAFPAMSSTSERRHAVSRASGLVAALGALCTAVTWLLPGLALVFVGGENYEDIRGSLWAFAALGTVLALLQLLIYALLAGNKRQSLLVVWCGLIAVTLLGAGTDSLGALLAVVLGIDATLLALLAVAARRMAVARPGSAPRQDPVDSRSPHDRGPG